MSEQLLSFQLLHVIDRIELGIDSGSAELKKVLLKLQALEKKKDAITKENGDLKSEYKELEAALDDYRERDAWDRNPTIVEFCDPCGHVRKIKFDAGDEAVGIKSGYITPDDENWTTIDIDELASLQAENESLKSRLSAYEKGVSQKDANKDRMYFCFWLGSLITVRWSEKNSEWGFSLDRCWQTICQDARLYPHPEQEGDQS